MTSIATGIFAYPWDLHDEGVDAAARRIRRELGFDSVALNVSYHSGRFLHPRHRNGDSSERFRGVINHRGGAGVSFTPAPELYGAITPAIDRPYTERDTIPRAVDALRQNGLGFDAWTVVLHNSTLGTRHPEHCVRNAFGDIYPYALCPADPEVRAYARALIEDVCSQFAPDTLALESPTYLGFVHGDHHELVLEPLDDVAQWLLGLCFHPSSRQAAEAHGVDSERLQRTVSELAGALIERPRGGYPAPFRSAEMTSLLLEQPDLYSYLRVRNQTVTSLLSELREVAAKHGVEVTTTSSIFERPTSRAWAEGVSLGAAAAAVDTVTAVSYFPEPTAVQADLDWLKLHIGERPFRVALNAGHPDALDAANLAAKVHIARDAGARSVTFYNYGLLSERRLGWLQHINRALGKEVEMPS